MDRKIIITAIFLGMLAIIFGAFGAHALKQYLDAQQLATFETGVRYQMYHALFLLAVPVIRNLSDAAKKAIWLLTILGVILFSGSIYLLATQPLSGINFKPIGFITPIGGLFLIMAWVVLLIKVARMKS